jgi:hypothetical protein
MYIINYEYNFIQSTSKVNERQMLLEIPISALWSTAIPVLLILWEDLIKVKLKLFHIGT